jgi:hypothetical protein
MSIGEVNEALTALRDAYATFAACDTQSLTPTELLEVMDELETHHCQLPTQNHHLLAQLKAQSTPAEMGAKSWRDVLTTRYRISTTEANRRLTDADLLAPRRALSGAPMPPQLAATAAAQRLGLITAEHVAVIRKHLKRLPGWVDTATRDRVEVDWVRHAVGSGPDALDDVARRTVYLLDQDGPPPDDAERARRRSIVFTKQRDDSTIGITGDLTPAAYAVWEVLNARFSAPGMCNPADEHPCTSGTPTQQQIDGDLRTPAQRRHDAFEYIGRMALDKTELGHQGGLPTTVIVRTTLQDLQTRAGIGVTGGGTIVPVADVLNMAAQKDATNYLAVFDDATGSVLDLFRTRRTASVAQRLALIVRDGGCTKPGCTVPAYGTQVHHATQDWSAGGDTNVDDLALACGPDNRAVTPGGWTTHITDTHDVEWIPPPRLDTGQKRTNDYHHPEQLRPPPDDAWHPDDADTWWVVGDKPVNTTTASETNAVEEVIAEIGADPDEPIPWWPVDPTWAAAEKQRAARKRLSDDTPPATGAPAHPEPAETEGTHDGYEPGRPEPPTGTAA